MADVEVRVTAALSHDFQPVGILSRTQVCKVQEFTIDDCLVSIVLARHDICHHIGIQKKHFLRNLKQ